MPHAHAACAADGYAQRAGVPLASSSTAQITCKHLPLSHPLSLFLWPLHPPLPQLSLQLQEKYLDIACPACNEIHTGRGKRMKAGSRGAQTTLEQLAPAASAWGLGPVRAARLGNLAQGAQWRRAAGSFQGREVLENVGLLSVALTSSRQAP